VDGPCDEKDAIIGAGFMPRMVTAGVICAIGEL